MEVAADIAQVVLNHGPAHLQGLAKGILKEARRSRNPTLMTVGHVAGLVGNPGRSPGRRTRKGIYYWTSMEVARDWATENGWPTDRIIDYEAGWAVQSGISGNYAGPGAKPTPWLKPNCGSSQSGRGRIIERTSFEYLD